MSGEASTPLPIQAKEQPVASSSTATDATKVNGTTPAQNANNNAPNDENKEVQDQSDVELTKLFTAKREEDMARRDRTLAEFLVMLDGYKPLVCLFLTTS
jgi:transcription initiation factor TFIID subunit 10